MNCLPSFGSRNFGGARPGGGIGVNGMRVLLDDLPGFRIDQPAIAVEEWEL
jgi:hypothetical protein